MHHLEYYIMRRVVLVFAATLAATVVITWVVQLLSRINFLTTSGQNFLTLLTFSSLFIPPIIPFVMPFALVIAVALVLAAMNRDSELVVITASGAPRRTIWRPLIMLGIFVALSSFIITNFVAPHARLSMRAMLAQSNVDLINLLLQEGNFRQVADRIYISIGERRSDGSIGKLFIVDESDEEVDLHYYAVDGLLAERGNNHLLILQKGEIQRIDRKSGDISIIQFDSYSFDLSSFAPTTRNVTIFPKDQFLYDLLNPDPQDSYYQRRPLHYTAELHQRLSAWLFPIIFVLIALVSNGEAHSHRERRFLGTFTTIFLSFALYWLQEMLVDWSENDPAYLPLLYLLPLTTLTITLILLATGYRLLLLASLDDRINLILDKFTQRSNLKHHKDKEASS